MVYSNYSISGLVIFSIVVFGSIVTCVNGSYNSSNNLTRFRTRNYQYICQEDEYDVERSVTNLGIACNCPSIYAPVCGSDNITYQNRCFMHCRAKHTTDRYHRYRLVLKKYGKC